MKEPNQLLPSLMDLIQSRGSVTGYEMEQVVSAALNSIDDDEAFIAGDLNDKYFSSDVENSFKPLKFVYYRVVRTKAGEYTLRRNLYMSPRATGYFSLEDETQDEIREVVRTKSAILGSELKRIVMDAISGEYEYPQRESSEEEVLRISYRNYSKQLAYYIYDYFINCEKPIKDDIWYGVSCKEYATATIYRDLEKSPRPQYDK